MESQPSQPDIIIIEGDPLTAELYQRELRRYFNVVTCTEVTAALDYIQEHEPSAVVLEPAGLGKKGWDFLATLKSLPALQSVPVILCSTLDERRKGLEMGAISFLLKPVLPSTLLQVLRQVTQNLSE
jgi:DNA-binding response OmpR family regulator